MKKMTPIILLSLFLVRSIFADDADCQDTNTFPTVSKQCSCIMTNAINDCSVHSPIKSICNAHSLGNYFKNSPSGAQSQCQRYGGLPEHCQWSVNFYDINC